MDVFWTLPPVTRTITAAAVAVSALGYGGVINLRQYIFVRQWVFTMKKMPEIWRLFTAFMITKPKFAILFDSYFLYRYGSDLEKESPRFSQPGDFFVYTMFLGSVIIGLAGCLLGSYTFLPALSLAYAYTFAQDNPTRSVSFFIITFEAKYLPLAMVFITFIVDGQHEALSQGTGIIAAHLYDFLTRIWPTFGGGRRYIFTPQIVKQWFGGRAGVQQARPYGFAQQGRGADTDSRPTGRAIGFGGQWDGRGPGRRLGGT